MTDVLSNALSSVKNFFSQLSPFGNRRHPVAAVPRGGQVNGRVHPIEFPQVPRLFSVQRDDHYSSRKRPFERIIEVEQEIELTDDEDESPLNNTHFSRYPSQNNYFPKRFKTSAHDNTFDHFDEMNNRTRSACPNPNIPGLDRQPWEFNFPDPKSKTPLSVNKTPGVKSSKGKTPKQNNVASCSSSASQPGGNPNTSTPPTTRESNSTMSAISRTKTLENHVGSSLSSGSHSSGARAKTKDVELITVIDDDTEVPADHHQSSSPFTCCNKKKANTSVIPTSTTTKQKRSFMSLLSNAGRKAIDPLSSTIRLEEKSVYKEMILKMSARSSTSFLGKHLQKSKINNSEVQAIYHNWRDSSPKVSFNYGRNSKSFGLSERVKQDLRLFSTPTGSRSSTGSTPIGSSSPPILIDLDDEEKEKSHHLALTHYKLTSLPPRHPTSKDLSLSTSFADLDEALNSTRYEYYTNSDTTPTEDPDQKAICSGEETDQPQKDDDIVILSEKIMDKYASSRLNSLALEQNLSPYVNRSWLSGVSSLRRDYQKRLDREIQEHLEIVDVLNTESTLEKDLREDIRRKLTLTEIIVLEEPPPKLPDITEAMRITIDTAKRPGREDDVLAKRFNIDFTRGDVKTLAPCKWLNDNVVNAYMELISQRSKVQQDVPKTHAFTTFFYPKLLKEGYSNALKRWTRKVDIFDHDLLVFPIHLGLHWCLACADLRNKTVKYYDSLGGRNDKCLNSLLNYLAQEMRERKGTLLNKEEWTLENVQDVPQQQNGSDCGVFTCKFAEYLSRDADLTFVQENMNYYRERMVYEIIENDLLYP